MDVHELLEVEYEAFISELLALSKQEIIDRAYQITVYEDFIALANGYSREHLKVLTNLDDTILYNFYLFISGFDDDTINDEAMSIFLEDIKDEFK